MVSGRGKNSAVVTMIRHAFVYLSAIGHRISVPTDASPRSTTSSARAQLVYPSYRNHCRTEHCRPGGGSSEAAVDYIILV